MSACLWTCFACGLDFEGFDASTRSDHRTFGPSGMHLRDQSGKPTADASVRRAHEFPADIVRAGGRPTKVTYKLQCSRCQRASVYEANGIKSDARVAEKFEQRGWLLGKMRDADVCPTCLGRDPNSQLANDQSSNNPAEMVLSPGQLAELVFMPKKMGEGSPVVVEVQGARRMSRARQQAEASLSSVFSGAKPTLTLGGVKPEPRAAAEAVFRAPVPRASVPPAQSSEAGGRPFASDRSEADGALRKDMSVLAAALTSMAEQISLMAQVQAAAIVENRDKADLHALLQKQNIELISRIAPVVASAQDLTAGGLREETSQPRDLVSTTPAAAPAAITEAPAETTVEASKAAELAQASAETTAPVTTEAAVEPAPVAKAVTPRVLPSLVSPMNQAPAVTETRKAPGKSGKSAKSAKAAKTAKAAKAAKSAGAKPRGSKAKVATSAVAKGAAEMPAETARPAVVSAESEATGSGKRFRRTKAQMEEFRREQQRLAELGLKRGRGRPSKNSLTAEQLAAIAASEDPEAARAEALASIREKPVATTSKEASEGTMATAEPEAEGRDASAAQSGQPVVNEAPAVEAVPTKARAERKSKAASVVETAPAAAPEPVAAAEGKRRGRKPKAAAIPEMVAAPDPTPEPAVPPEGKRRGPKPKAAAIAEAAAPAAEPSAATERKRGGRKPKAAATPETVAAPAAAPAQDIAPKRRGPKPKAATPEVAADAVAAPVVKRGRGRPRKDVAVPGSTVTAKALPAAESGSSVDWAKAKVTSDVMVLSSGKTTTMQIGRKVWQAAGFADDEAVFVSSSNGRDIKIAKKPGGRKPSSAKSSVITLTVPSIGEASLWKIKYLVDGGALLLRGKIAN